jgi:hypothetical protein
VRSAAASETQDVFGAVQDGGAAAAAADAPGIVGAAGASSGSAATVETSISTDRATPDGHPTDDDVWVEQPDAEAAAPVLDWLRALPAGSGLRAEGGQEPSWPDRNVGWWMRASRRTMARFAGVGRAAGGAAYFATSARRLLGGGRGVRRGCGLAVGSITISAGGTPRGAPHEADLARGWPATTLRQADSGWVRRTSAPSRRRSPRADLGIDAGAGAALDRVADCRCFTGHAAHARATRR